MINPFYSTRVVMVVIVLLTILLEQTIFNTSNLVYPHIVGIEAIYLKKRRIALLWGIVTSLIYRCLKQDHGEYFLVVDCLVDDSRRLVP